MSAENKIRMARLARIDRKLAELDAERAELQAERAQVFEELADGEQAVDLRTQRRSPTPHVPKLPPISDTDRAAARQGLRHNAIRRRVG
jgi:chromosome segregation ATPase